MRLETSMKKGETEGGFSLSVLPNLILHHYKILYLIS